MSSGLTVEVVPQVPAGELQTRYDDDAGILIAESWVENEWPFGINVNGTMVFDLDADRTLSNVDVLWPRRRWPQGLDTGPTRFPTGSLVFTPEAVERKNYDVALRLSTSSDRRWVRIDVGEGPPDGGVMLAPGCTAFLRGSELAGFFFELRDG